MLNTENLCPLCMSEINGEKTCPNCGREIPKRAEGDCLPLYMLLAGRYIVGTAKRRNNEDIIYIGKDTADDSVIEIREYFPKNYAVRNPDKTVAMIKGGEYTFNEGLLEFLEINRQIKGSELPALIPVMDVFEENGTVYAVSQKISSITLKDFLSRNGGSLKWEQTRPLFLPLIDTIKGMNDLGIIHGGISASTILVGRDGKLRISDYSVKGLRRIGDGIEAELYSGFAALEQYKTDDMQIGTHTDVYALCAVLFNVIIGTVPAEAPERLENDSLTIPAKFAEELPRHVLSALANGLQVLPQNRTPDIETFKNELVYAETAEPEIVRKKPATPEKAPADTPKNKGNSAKYAIISAICTAVAFLVIVGILCFTVFREGIFGKNESSNPNSNLSTSAPSVDSIGTVDSGAEDTTVLFEVPEVAGKYYAEILENEDYEKFEFIIKGKEFSDKYQRGQISAQSIPAGKGVARDTKIELTISLGPKEIKIANLVGLDENTAKLELLKQGFLYDNIEILEKYDEDKEPGSVLEQEPKYGTQVSTDTAVKVYINSYNGSDDLSNTSIDLTER